MNKYTERCNNPAVRDEWRNSGLVSIGTVKPNTIIESIDGDLWVIDGPTRSGTVMAHPWGRDGEPTTFVASAMVLPVENCKC